MYFKHELGKGWDVAYVTHCSNCAKSSLQGINNTWVGEYKVVVVGNMINYCGSDQTKEKVL